MARFFISSMVVFLSILASSFYGLHAMDSPAILYWKQKLPNTPVPSFLRELIVSGASLRKAGELFDPALESSNVYSEPANALMLLESSNVQIYSEPGDAQMLSNPALSMFFLEKDLHPGTRVLLYLGKRLKGPQAYFLSRHLSHKIPFSSDKISVVLKDFKIPEGSRWAKIMKHTVALCERPATNGESRYCATSLESMVDYSISRQRRNHVNVLVTNVTKNSVKQLYTITAVPFESKSGSVSVVCHTEAYAYAVYYCHEALHTKTVKVSLKGEDGTTAEGVAVCHANTSAWTPNHVAFKLLNVKPGGPAVCHFMAEDGLVWLSTN